MTRRRTVIGLLCLALVWLTAAPAGAGEQAKTPAVLALLPAAGEVAGWLPEDEPEYAAGEDLFYLINGGAAIYREYGFNEAVYQTYVTGDGRSINLEIYAMEAPASAYGIYSFKTGKDGEPVESVPRSWLESYYLNFWKGNYQVTVVGLDGEETTRQSLIDFAAVIEGKIESESPTPRIVELFPHEGLLPNGVTYLKGNLALFNQYLFDRTNVFGVGEGAIAEYEDHSVFVFEYAHQEASKKWFASARDFLEQSERFANFTDMENEFEIEDAVGHTLTVTAHGRYIVVVKGEKSTDAQKLLEDYRHILE